jgi:hypothetical protein
MVTGYPVLAVGFKLSTDIPIVTLEEHSDIGNGEALTEGNLKKP